MKKKYVCLCWICLFALFYFPITAAINYLYETGYKKGQIDSALGQQWYHLYTHDDGTKTWEKVEDPHNIPERYDGYGK